MQKNFGSLTPITYMDMFTRERKEEDGSLTFSDLQDHNILLCLGFDSLSKTCKDSQNIRNWLSGKG